MTGVQTCALPISTAAYLQNPTAYSDRSVVLLVTGSNIPDDLRLRNAVNLRHRLDRWLRAGYGECHLRNPRIATTVERAFRHFDGTRYTLVAWVVMPNHVHVLIETFAGHPLANVVNSWKTFTAREANRILGRQGQFWYREYFDRAIRDERHLHAAIRYIHANPVTAGLGPTPEDWPYSSASRFGADDELDHPGR